MNDLKIIIAFTFLLFSNLCLAEKIECPDKLSNVTQNAVSVKGWTVAEVKPHLHKLHSASVQISVEAQHDVYWNDEREDNYDNIVKYCESLNKDDSCKATSVWALDPKSEYRLECSYFQTSVVLRRSLKGYKKCLKNQVNWQIRSMTCTK